MTADRRAYRARWLFPADGPPVEQGTLIVEDGLVTDLTTAEVPEAVDLPDAAIIPGLVNAHTHLEFSHLETPLTPALPFTGWIGSVVAARRDIAWTSEQKVARGVHELLDTGTVAVGEIATSPASKSILREAALDSILFREIIGLLGDHAPILDDLRRSFSEPAGSRGHHGVSPHAPYSVDPGLFVKLVRLAAEFGRPVAMHLGETQSELEFLRSGTGEFRAMLHRINSWPGDLWNGEWSLLDYLRVLAESTRALVVHGNYLNADEQAFLEGRSNLSVVYCPRTHAYFQHSPHPWRSLLARGVNVVLGTDGRCSNPDLSVWNEVLFLRERFPEASPRTLLAMITHRAADALGLNESAYRLRVGEPLRCTVIGRLPPEESDPYAAILHPGTHARSLP